MVYTVGYNGHGQMGNEFIQNLITPWCISKKKINVDNNIITMQKTGEQKQITFNSTLEFNLIRDDVPNSKYTYKSIDTNIATVDNNGLVTAKAIGTTYVKITDESNNVSAAIKINITGEGDLTFAKVIGGHNHFIALKGNGEVYTWGYNANGELGLGDNQKRTEPTQVKAEITLEDGTTKEEEITDAIDVAAGANHTLILRKDGTVWATGYNNKGQLGEDMDGLIENIKIAGIASCVPRHTEDNMDYGNVLGEKRVKKQVKLTGIRKRHTSRIEQRASDLAICAANDLLTKLDWKKDEIGVLIYMTQSPDYLIPSTAIALQERMGLPKEVIAFDVNLGCSSFGYGIHIASSLMNTIPACKKALCLVADRVEDMESKRLLNADTVSFSLLTGSAASAVAIEKKQGACITFSESCDGSHYDAILARSPWTGTYMQGNMVFEYAINDVIKGWRADASYFYIAKAFVRDEIDVEILEELLLLGGLETVSLVAFCS